MDGVDRPQFRVVKGVRVPPLWWSGGWGGHGLPVLVQCCASRGGCPGVVPRCPSGTFPVEGSRCWGIEQDAAVGGELADF